MTHIKARLRPRTRTGLVVGPHGNSLSSREGRSALSAADQSVVAAATTLLSSLRANPPVDDLVHHLWAGESDESPLKPPSDSVVSQPQAPRQILRARSTGRFESDGFVDSASSFRLRLPRTSGVGEARPRGQLGQVSRGESS